MTAEVRAMTQLLIQHTVHLQPKTCRPSIRHDMVSGRASALETAQLRYMQVCWSNFLQDHTDQQPSDSCKIRLITSLAGDNMMPDLPAAPRMCLRLVDARLLSVVPASDCATLPCPHVHTTPACRRARWCSCFGLSDVTQRGLKQRNPTLGTQEVL